MYVAIHSLFGVGPSLEDNSQNQCNRGGRGSVLSLRQPGWKIIVAISIVYTDGGCCNVLSV